MPQDRMNLRPSIDAGIEAMFASKKKSVIWKLICVWFDAKNTRSNAQHATEKFSRVEPRLALVAATTAGTKG